MQDVWHGGGANHTDRMRLVVETVYGRRKVAQKFFPYIDVKLAEATMAAATPRQRRLLGASHIISTYG